MLELIPVGPTTPPVFHLHLHLHTHMHLVWPLANFLFSILSLEKIHNIVGGNKVNTLRSLPIKCLLITQHFMFTFYLYDIDAKGFINILCLTWISQMLLVSRAHIFNVKLLFWTYFYSVYPEVSWYCVVACKPVCVQQTVEGLAELKQPFLFCAVKHWHRFYTVTTKIVF